MRHTRLLIPALGLLLAASAPAAGSPAPAAPAAQATRPAPIPTNDYELRGFFGAGDKLEVSIAKKGTPGSTWIPLGKKRGDIRLEQASSKEGTAVIVTGGQRLLVRLASEKAPSPGTASVEEGHLPESLKKLSPEEQRKALEAIESFFKNFSEAQRKLMQDEVQKSLASDPSVIATIMKIQASGKAPSEQDQADIAKIMMPHLGEAVKKAATLPGKDGVLRPIPAYFDDVLKIAPQVLDMHTDSGSAEAEGGK